MCHPPGLEKQHLMGSKFCWSKAEKMEARPSGWGQKGPERGEARTPIRGKWWDTGKKNNRCEGESRSQPTVAPPAAVEHRQRSWTSSLPSWDHLQSLPHFPVPAHYHWCSRGMSWGQTQGNFRKASGPDSIPGVVMEDVLHSTFKWQLMTAFVWL